MIVCFLFICHLTVVDILSDIEDMLKTVAFLKGHKWTTLMIKRAYFGNTKLRSYSPLC
jgi:Heterokaryon incompatibility protein Het-C